MTRLQVGDPAPDFELVSDSGTTFRLSSQRGAPVVLFFYPEDDTEGCTIENLEYTQSLPAFQKLGVRLAGISPDSVEKHCAFRDKHGLGVPLLADPDRVALDAYGVWGEKKTFGHAHIGVHRTSFLIDRDGRLAGVYPVRRIKGHAAHVLADAERLVAGG